MKCSSLFFLSFFPPLKSQYHKTKRAQTKAPLRTLRDRILPIHTESGKSAPFSPRDSCNCAFPSLANIPRHTLKASVLLSISLESPEIRIRTQLREQPGDIWTHSRCRHRVREIEIERERRVYTVCGSCWLRPGRPNQIPTITSP